MKRILRKVRAIERVDLILAITAIFIVVVLGSLQVYTQTGGLGWGRLSERDRVILSIFIGVMSLSMVGVVLRVSVLVIRLDIPNRLLREWRDEAEDEKTSTARLKELSRVKDTELKVAIAQNLKTPAITLFQLFDDGGEVREAVTKNPNFKLEKYIDEFLNVGEDFSLLTL